MRSPNAQYNVAAHDSLAIKVALGARIKMFHEFMEKFKPNANDTILDVGVTSERTYSCSNYFEKLYPFPHNLTACGLDDASFLEIEHPGLRFVQTNALDLPFENDSFDFVHSSAVLEHVGGTKNQLRLVSECLRASKEGVFITTPNRWFPIDFHTLIPLVHWLPKSTHRKILDLIGLSFFAQEENLNLLSRRECATLLRSIGVHDFCIDYLWTFGWPSNLLIYIPKARNQRG